MSSPKSQTQYNVIIFICLSILCINSVFSKRTTCKHKFVIFIHGTKGPFTSIPAFSKLWKKEQETTQFCKSKISSIYQKYQKLFLDNVSFNGFHKYQPIGDFGLVKIAPDTKNYRVNSLFANLLQKSYKESFPECQNTRFSFYTFGWDGRLDPEKRRLWSEKLYKSLLKETKKCHDQPEIDIYAHSHACNLTLNLATCEEAFEEELSISNLILFGIPIQKSTATFITHPMFKKIYYIYSYGDLMAICDQGLTGSGFAFRKFEDALPASDIPKNLVQIEVEAENVKPSHSELWFWGENESNFLYRTIFNIILYRKSFPLYPLPISTLMPQIISQIENNHPGARDLHLNIEKSTNKATTDSSSYRLYLEAK